MPGCTGCVTGSSFNPGGHYAGVRINENEDGRVVFCDTQGISVQKGQRVVWLEAGGAPSPAVAVRLCPTDEDQLLEVISVDKDEALLLHPATFAAQT